MGVVTMRTLTSGIFQQLMRRSFPEAMARADLDRFLLNYVLILGPLTNACILVLVGMMSFDSTGRALLPAVAYLAIHVIEGEGLTPSIVARRFTLNPVLIVLSLIFWFWMWGIAGALLAVPLLAIFKMVCDRVAPLAGVGHFIGG